MESGVVGKQRAGAITVEKLEAACSELMEQVAMLESDLVAMSVTSNMVVADKSPQDIPMRSGLNDRLIGCLGKIIAATARIAEQRDILEF